MRAISLAVCAAPLGHCRYTARSQVDDCSAISARGGVASALVGLLGTTLQPIVRQHFAWEWFLSEVGLGSSNGALILSLTGYAGHHTSRPTMIGSTPNSRLPASSILRTVARSLVAVQGAPQ